VKHAGQYGFARAASMDSLGPDEELKLETSASFRISLRWPIHIINQVDKTKLSYKYQTDLFTFEPCSPTPLSGTMIKFSISIFFYIAAQVKASKIEASTIENIDSSV